MTREPGRKINPDPSWTQKDLVLVAILTFAGLVLRVIGLNEGMWFDEIATLVDYIRLPATQIIGHYTTLNNHVFYSLLAHFSAGWFVESAWSLRLPAVSFGVATIPAAYYLGRQITARREAFLAAAFLALSYLHVWFSQDARGYTGLVLGVGRIQARGIQGSPWRLVPYLAWRPCDGCRHLVLLKARHSCFGRLVFASCRDFVFRCRPHGHHFSSFPVRLNGLFPVNRRAWRFCPVPGRLADVNRSPGNRNRADSCTGHRWYVARCMETKTGFCRRGKIHHQATCSG